MPNVYLQAHSKTHNNSRVWWIIANNIITGDVVWPDVLANTEVNVYEEFFTLFSSRPISSARRLTWASRPSFLTSTAPAGNKHTDTWVHIISHTATLTSCFQFFFTQPKFIGILLLLTPSHHKPKHRLVNTRIYFWRNSQTEFPPFTLRFTFNPFEPPAPEFADRKSSDSSVKTVRSSFTFWFIFLWWTICAKNVQAKMCLSWLSNSGWVIIFLSNWT